MAVRHRNSGTAMSLQVAGGMANADDILQLPIRAHQNAAQWRGPQP